jgi:hypothetical protein
VRPTRSMPYVVRGVGARFGGIGQGLWGEVFEVKERVRKMIEAIRDTSCSRFRDKDNMRPIVKEGGTPIEGASAVRVPGFALEGRVVDDNQLAWGVGGVGGEIDWGTVDAVPCGFGGVWGEATHVVEGEFSGREQVRSMIGGKSYVGRRKD